MWIERKGEREGGRETEEREKGRGREYKAQKEKTRERNRDRKTERELAAAQPVSRAVRGAISLGVAGRSEVAGRSDS